MNRSLKGLSVVIPVYKEDPEALMRLYCDLCLCEADVIIVDDGDTVDLPDDFNEISYKPNMGYGYALKKGIEASRNEVVLTLDGDGQHSVEDAIRLYNAYKLDNFDMLIGSRWDIKEKPLRWIGRKVLNFIASLIAGHYMIDLNSGMRIFKKHLAVGYAPILCDTFSYTTSITMSFLSDRYKVWWFPINVQPRNYGKSRVRVIKDGFVTVFYIVKIGLALRTRGIRSCIRKAFGQST